MQGCIAGMVGEVETWHIGNLSFRKPEIDSWRLRGTEPYRNKVRDIGFDDGGLAGRLVDGGEDEDALELVELS